jgi:hypothetical protein
VRLPAPRLSQALRVPGLPPDPRLLLGALALLLALLLAPRLLFGWRLRRRFTRAAAAEREAVVLARRAGYRVLDTQVSGRARLWVDGRGHEVEVRADLLLARFGRRFIAEVKTGAKAPDPTDRNTRRQLLEYHHAFAADGLLLFDMEARRIHRVDFGPPPGRPRWAWLLAGALLGAALARAPELAALLRGWAEL